MPGYKINCLVFKKDRVYSGQDLVRRSNCLGEDLGPLPKPQKGTTLWRSQSIWLVFGVISWDLLITISIAWLVFEVTSWGLLTTISIAWLVFRVTYRMTGVRGDKLRPFDHQFYRMTGVQGDISHDWCLGWQVEAPSMSHDLSLGNYVRPSDEPVCHTVFHAVSSSLS